MASETSQISGSSSCSRASATYPAVAPADHRAAQVEEVQQRHGAPEAQGADDGHAAPVAREAAHAQGAAWARGASGVGEGLDNRRLAKSV